jgi:hypothetical protein
MGLQSNSAELRRGPLPQDMTAERPLAIGPQVPRRGADRGLERAAAAFPCVDPVVSSLSCPVLAPRWIASTNRRASSSNAWRTTWSSSSRAGGCSSCVPSYEIRRGWRAISPGLGLSLRSPRTHAVTKRRPPAMPVGTRMRVSTRKSRRTCSSPKAGRSLAAGARPQRGLFDLLVVAGALPGVAKQAPHDLYSAGFRSGIGTK